MIFRFTFLCVLTAFLSSCASYREVPHDSSTKPPFDYTSFYAGNTYVLMEESGLEFEFLVERVTETSIWGREVDNPTQENIEIRYHQIRYARNQTQIDEENRVIAGAALELSSVPILLIVIPLLGASVASVILAAAL